MKEEGKTVIQHSLKFQTPYSLHFLEKKTVVGCVSAYSIEIQVIENKQTWVEKTASHRLLCSITSGRYLEILNSEC
jgi:hypothetical protein